MHLLLTYFHLYSRKHVLQDNIQNQVENTQNKVKKAQSRTCIPESAQRREMEKAHLRNYLDRSTNMAGIQAQPEAHWSKSATSEAGQGGCGRTAPSPARPHFALAVAWRHATSVSGGYHFHLR
jgi:hypothetical protein